MNTLIGFIYRIFANREYLMLLALIFLAVTLGMFGTYFLIFQRDYLKKRFARFIPGANPNRETKDSALVEGEIKGVVQKLSNPIFQAVVPDKEETRKQGRLKLIRAGFRSNAAYRNYLVLKFFCAVVFPLCFLFTTFFYKLSTVALTGGVALAIFGFFLPSLVLKVITYRRQLDITRALPDALDLMVVCSESGLGLDMTFKRVGEELRPLSKHLSDEFSLTIMEIRAGKPRTDSFRAMSLRTGVQEVNNLMTILIPASRSGTSMAKALRVHAEAMRVKRRQIAEEKAAKVSVKLIFPLVLFIFPALMIVIAGPAFIQIFRLLLPTLAGG